MLSGDVESNPGPTHDLSSATSMASSSGLQNKNISAANSSTSKSTITAVLFNARSIVNKTPLLQIERESNKHDLIFVTESWLDNTILDGELIPDTESSIFRNDRNRHGGGVFIIAANHLSPVRKIIFEHDNLELLMLETRTKHGKSLFGCLYRPPSASVTFFDDYQMVLEKILPFSHQYLAITIVGDFNINSQQSNVSSMSPSAQRLSCLSDTLNMEQLVNFYTRESSSSLVGSIIDLLFTNRPDLFSNVEVYPGLGTSDHNGISFNMLTSYDYDYEPFLLSVQ